MTNSFGGCLERLGSCRWRGILVVVGGVLIQIAIGSGGNGYTFGNFSPYIVSFLRLRAGEATLRNVDTLWLGTIASIGELFGMLIAGLMERNFGSRKAATTGAAIYLLCVSMSYFTVQHSFILFLIIYGPFCGFGSTICYGSTVQTVMKWFPQRRGLAGGIVLAAYGGGGLIFNQVITLFINPDNKSPVAMETSDSYFTDAEVLDRVPYCFLLLGGIFLAILIVGILLLGQPGSDLEQPEATESVETEKAVENQVTVEDLNTCGFSEDHNMQKDVTAIDDHQRESKVEQATTIQELPPKAAIKKMLTSRNFYVMWILFFCLIEALYVISTLYKAYGQTFIHDDHFLALAGSLTAVTNSLPRAMWGAIYDRYRFQMTLQCIIVGFASLNFTFLLSEHGGKPVFLIWVCGMFFFLCGPWPCMMSTFSKLYGTQNMAMNYSFLQTASLVASLVATVTSTSLEDMLGWHGMFFLSGGFLTFAFVVSFFFDGKLEDGKRV